MLELRKPNSEDAQDHLHAKTYQRETKKGRARSMGKSLNGHVETTRYANTKRYVFTICNNVLITMNEGAQI